MALGEAIKELWTIADSANTDNKDRIKVLTLVTQYTNERLELIKSEPNLMGQKKFIETAKMIAGSG